MKFIVFLPDPAPAGTNTVQLPGGNDRNHPYDVPDLPVCDNTEIVDEGLLTSPNYPENYPTQNVICYSITAPLGQRVRALMGDNGERYLEIHVSQWCMYYM